MDRSRQNYRAYTLRLSRVGDTGAWRATLYSAQSGERRHFGDLAALYAFLQQTTTEEGAGPAERGDEETST
jgi:hypothetical protein